MTKTYNDIDAVTRLLEEVGCSAFTCRLNRTFTHHLPFSCFQPIERERFGAGRQDRPVASQEEQSSDGAERLPGGARGADRRGGATANQTSTYVAMATRLTCRLPAGRPAAPRAEPEGRAAAVLHQRGRGERGRGRLLRLPDVRSRSLTRLLDCVWRV